MHSSIYKTRKSIQLFIKNISINFISLKTNIDVPGAEGSMINEISFLDCASSTSEIRIEEKGLTPLDVIPPVSSLPHRREGVVEIFFLDDFKRKARFIFPDVEEHFVSVAIIGMVNDLIKIQYNIRLC
jgi:hypothetical protein